ncbi:hypothetical protein [Acetobacter okinawensis]|uniref:hypothetical protein n=1 Tax=Acetobacter okinawensis TaxID=1076594 RepID=UPI00131EF5D7
MSTAACVAYRVVAKICRVACVQSGCVGPRTTKSAVLAMAGRMVRMSPACSSQCAWVLPGRVACHDAKIWCRVLAWAATDWAKRAC